MLMIIIAFTIFCVHLGDYVDKLMSSHMPAMSTDDLCVLLTDKVNDIAGHGMICNVLLTV